MTEIKKATDPEAATLLAGAAMLNMEIALVDGLPKLRHLFPKGDPKRPPDDEVERFRSLFTRDDAASVARRDKVILALGGDPHLAPPPGHDARILKEWIERTAVKGDGFSITQDGRRIHQRTEASKLLHRFADTPDWILQAYRLKKDITAPTTNWEAEAGGIAPSEVSQ